MAFFEGEAKDSEQVHIGAINCAPPFTHQREDFNTCRNGIDRHGEKTVSVDPLSSRGINKFHIWKVTSIWRVTLNLSKYTNFYQSCHDVLQTVSHQGHVNPGNLNIMSDMKTMRQPRNPCLQTLVLVWRTIMTNFRKTRSLIM